MKSSNYTWIPAIIVMLVAGGCDGSNGVGFSGVGAPPPAPVGGGGGVTVNLVHQIEAQSALFDAEISDDSLRLIFVGDENIGGQNPNNGEQIFGVDLVLSDTAQVTTAAATNFRLFSGWDITNNGLQVLFASRDDLAGTNPALSHNLFVANTDGSGFTTR